MFRKGYEPTTSTIASVIRNAAAGQWGDDEQRRLHLIFKWEQAGGWAKVKRELLKAGEQAFCEKVERITRAQNRKVSVLPPKLQLQEGFAKPAMECQVERVYLIRADEEFDGRVESVKAVNLYPLPYTFLLIYRQRDGTLRERFREHRVYSPAEDRWHVKSIGIDPDVCLDRVWQWKRGIEDLREDEWMFCEGFRKAVIAIDFPTPAEWNDESFRSGHLAGLPKPNQHREQTTDAIQQREAGK